MYTYSKNKSIFALTISAILIMSVMSMGVASAAPARDTSNVKQSSGITKQGATTTAEDLAFAMGIPADTLVSASLGTTDLTGVEVSFTPSAGFPEQGQSYAVLSSGNAADAPTENTSESISTVLTNSGTAPVTDVTQLTVVLDPPKGANSLSFKVKFMSDEFAEFVGSAFNDLFLVEKGEHNFSVDPSTFVVTAPNNQVQIDGQLLSINTVGTFAMSLANAAGSTYDGATPSIIAKIPIAKTEQDSLTLIFTVADVSDQIYDTTVYLDDFSYDKGTITEPVLVLPSELFCQVVSDVDISETGAIPLDTLLSLEATLLAGGTPVPDAEIKITSGKKINTKDTTDADGNAAAEVDSSTLGNGFHQIKFSYAGGTFNGNKLPASTCVVNVLVGDVLSGFFELFLHGLTDLGNIPVFLHAVGESSVGFFEFDVNGDGIADPVYFNSLLAGPAFETPSELDVSSSEDIGGPGAGVHCEEDDVCVEIGTDTALVADSMAGHIFVTPGEEPITILTGFVFDSGSSGGVGEESISVKKLAATSNSNLFFIGTLADDGEITDIFGNFNEGTFGAIEGFIDCDPTINSQCDPSTYADELADEYQYFLSFKGNEKKTSELTGGTAPIEQSSGNYTAMMSGTTNVKGQAHTYDLVVTGDWEKIGDEPVVLSNPSGTLDVTSSSFSPACTLTNIVTTLSGGDTKLTVKADLSCTPSASGASKLTSAVWTISDGIDFGSGDQTVTKPSIIAKFGKSTLKDSPADTASFTSAET